MRISSFKLNTSILIYCSILFLILTIILTNDCFANSSPLAPIETAITSNTKSIMTIASKIMLVYFIISVVIYVFKKSNFILFVLLPFVGTALIFAAEKIMSWAQTIIQ